MLITYLYALEMHQARAQELRAEAEQRRMVAQATAARPAKRRWWHAG